jgi:hypothetical protein
MRFRQRQSVSGFAAPDRARGHEAGSLSDDNQHPPTSGRGAKLPQHPSLWERNIGCQVQLGFG